jgi:hypothetical protein
MIACGKTPTGTVAPTEPFTFTAVTELRLEFPTTAMLSLRNVAPVAPELAGRGMKRSTAAPGTLTTATNG